MDSRHAVIYYSGVERCYVLQDLCSTYGCFVNGSLVRGTTVRLRHKDWLQFGVEEHGSVCYQLIIGGSADCVSTLVIFINLR